MPRTKRAEIKEKDITGLKYFAQLGGLLEELHNVGCERDRSGNRSLHMDEYCMLVLLYLFNPIVTSLRGLQQASDLKKVQKKLGCPRASLGSLSESVAVFEPERLERAIEPDRTYAFDRGYAKFELFNKIVDAGSSYVGRIRDNSVYEVLEERPLTEADRAARVLSDQIISLGSDSSKSKLNHPVRLVVIEAKPHKSKGRVGGGSTGQDCDGFLRIATNLLHVPAEIIALLYFYRWTIEIFFRFLKHILGCRHLLSQSQKGIEIQVYCAIIACMLISLWTGRRPTLRTHEMICWYFRGMADEDELLAHISRLDKQTD